MVLGIQLRFFASIAFFVAVCTNAAAGEPISRVMLGKHELGLLERDARCLVEYSGILHDALLPAPCRFLRRGQTERATAHSYDGQVHVVLIAGPLAHPNDYSRSDYLSPADKCSHLAIGVVARKNSLSFTEVFIEPLGYCAEAAPDEKFYFGIANKQVGQTQ